MIKVKCCNNCKYCHMTPSKPMLCVVKGITVQVDNKCEAYLCEDIMEKLAELDAEEMAK